MRLLSMMEVKVSAVEGKKLITDRLFQGDRLIRCRVIQV